MIQGIKSSDERFLSALDKINQRIQTAETQLSSGRRLNSASDAPDSISAVLAARANLDQTTQIGLNLSRAKSEADTSEGTLETVSSLLDRLRTLAAQGASETLEPSARKTISVEVSSILEQLVNASSTSVGGRYVFGGDSDQTPPYTLIPATDTSDASVSAYNGTASTREVMHPNGTRFPVAHSAQDIFDAPGASVFQAVTDLRDALENVPTVATDDPDYQTQYKAQTQQINDALNSIKTAGVHMSDELAFYGVVQNRITEATDFASKLTLQQQEQLSAVQDADIPSAAIALTQAQTQLSTAMSARAKITSTSLFDYLR
jgi:flagellar hook-associated protein 3 FlgL